MQRRLLVVLLVAMMVAALAACHNKKVRNPIADLDSKQPDKVLFDRAMEAMKRNKFDVARMSLQTLINTYPDSEFVARAKLSVGDSWYAEGGSAALAQAEAEYKDFITFFPNMPEAAEAQMKIANIEYQQMEKPDRDFTHAKRAEDEYRQVILQFPDSKLVPQAKERLREVQEVLAEREFRIGRFYYLRESWAAAMARLQSLVDAYPLYSGADEALFLLGDTYQRQAELVRATKIPDERKQPLLKDLDQKAADAFSRIITRYPVTDRAEDAKSRLQAMNRPIPTPTPEAIALNKQEEESRLQKGLFGRAMMNFRKRPDVSLAARVGEPTLVDPRPVSAPDIVKQQVSVLSGTGTGKVTVETLGSGSPPPNQPVPRSDAETKPDDTGVPELTPMTSGEGDATAPANNSNSGDPNAPAAAPAQVNEAAQSDDAKAETSSSDSDKNENKNNSKSQSSSKQKKKSGLRKLMPF
ncbi:MAG: outer membrane protein assembly factor BamD [Terriglobales bacterium]